MEKVQVLEITYDEHIREDNNQRMEDVSVETIETEAASLRGDLCITEREHVAGDFETVENVKAVQESNQDVVEDELELSKHKVKDNLSEICKKNTENMIKWQTKADIAIKCLDTELHTAVENRTSLEKFLHECEFQQSYLQDQLDLEQADRVELSREMVTAETIINILKAKLEAYEDDLNKSKIELFEQKNEIDEVINSYMLQEESFKKEFETNDSKIQELKNEFEKKRLHAMENEEKFINKKIQLEGDIVRLNEELANAKKNNQELLERKAERIKERIEKEDNLKELQEELNSVRTKRIQLSRQLQAKDNAEIKKKRVEVEILKERLATQQEYLDDLTKNLESLKSENVSLLSTNKKIKQDIAEYRKKYDDLTKTLEVNRTEHKNELLTYAENKKRVEQEIAELDTRILEVANNNKESKKKLEFLKENMENANATILSLNTIKNNVKIEIEEQIVLNQKYNAQKESMSNTLTDLQSQILQLEKDFVKKEQDFNALQSTFAKEIKDLEEILENEKVEQISLTKQKEEFEKTKIEDEKRLITLKEEHAAELKQLEIKLKMLKEEEDSATATVKDLNEKLQVKTEKRDNLHSEYRKLQEEIDRLEERVKTIKKDTPSTLPTTTTAIFQKPTGILKNSKVKSPQKKVTFDNSINWDTLSESSTDAFFDSLLKKKSAPVTENKRPKSAIDEILDLLHSNSPPEREINN